MARDVSVTRGSGSSLRRLYESESEREGIEEIHSYHGDTTVKAKLDLLAKAVTSLLS